MRDSVAHQQYPYVTVPARRKTRTLLTTEKKALDMKTTGRGVWVTQQRTSAPEARPSFHRRWAGTTEKISVVSKRAISLRHCKPCRVDPTLPPQATRHPICNNGQAGCGQRTGHQHQKLSFARIKTGGKTEETSGYENASSLRHCTYAVRKIPDTATADNKALAGEGRTKTQQRHRQLSCHGSDRTG
jgi:hypothetical protein